MPPDAARAHTLPHTRTTAHKQRVHAPAALSYLIIFSIAAAEYNGPVPAVIRSDVPGDDDRDANSDCGCGMSSVGATNYG